MSNPDFIAIASTRIEASPEAVWDALVDPERITDYMFGTVVGTDWAIGSPITWSGEWQGRSYEDKGEILEFDPGRQLRYSHYSPLTGDPDVPESYHTVEIRLAASDIGTDVTLTQGNNESREARDHSQANWEAMLAALKEHVESTD